MRIAARIGGHQEREERKKSQERRQWKEEEDPDQKHVMKKLQRGGGVVPVRPRNALTDLDPKESPCGLDPRLTEEYLLLVTKEAHLVFRNRFEEDRLIFLKKSPQHVVEEPAFSFFLLFLGFPRIHVEETTSEGRKEKSSASLRATLTRSESRKNCPLLMSVVDSVSPGVTMADDVSSSRI